MRPRERNAILRGISGANDTLDAFALEERNAGGLAPIDVFGLLSELDIPLRFRPLDPLLGACIRVGGVTAGIIVTTRRDLHMQRFTAAHELGHFVLEHEGSLDRDIRMPGHTSGREIVEIEADAFAAELLMPEWLVAGISNRLSWSRQNLVSPSDVYQLSLRLALSYEATCWGLASHELITRRQAMRLAAHTPKQIKLEALKGVTLKNPWADVWQLGEADNESVLHATPDDIIIVELEENPTSGYRWNAEDALARGYHVLRDIRTRHPGLVGAKTTRTLFITPPEGASTLTLDLRRSFSSAEPVAALEVNVCAFKRMDDDVFEGLYEAPEARPSVVIH